MSPGQHGGLTEEWSPGLLAGFFLTFLATLALCCVIHQVEGEPTNDDSDDEAGTTGTRTKAE